MDKILKVAIAAVGGEIPAQFSKEQTSAALREAFIKLNGGEKKINPKTFYRGNKLFDLVETLLAVIIDEGIKEDNELMNLCEYINIANGDINEFRINGVSNFVVSDVAAGIQGVRRQRISDGQTVSVTTNPKAVRVYEGLSRLLAGKIDFDEFINGVAASFQSKIREDAYNCLSAVTISTAGVNSTYVISGTYNEDTLISLIDHVEASTGKAASIVGTRAALRKLTQAGGSDSAKDDLYKLGFYGYFNGTPMIRMRSAHKPGGDVFAFSDSKVYVLATDTKPIKIVNEGDGIMQQSDAIKNADLTQEYVYIQSYGVGAIFNEKVGIYTITEG